jgi:uroporphyrinogen-III decarboxylase
MGMIDRGYIPLVLWEGDCTSRLETIADLPRGKAIYWFERTDLARAKAVLGDVVCLRGNVPPSMLNMGTPDEVREYCRNLIKTVGKNGGFILDGGIGIPDEAKVENVRAMYAAVREFGKYS